MFWPLWSIGWPSTSHPSAPFGKRISRGARSRHCSGTYLRHPSGGVSTCPSPEITWYVRAIPTILSAFCGRYSAPVPEQRRVGGQLLADHRLPEAQKAVAVDVAHAVDPPLGHRGVEGAAGGEHVPRPL